MLQPDCTNFYLNFAQLKFRVYILSALLFGLSCYPCVQEYCDDRGESFVNNSNDHEQEDSEANELASRFVLMNVVLHI